MFFLILPLFTVSKICGKWVFFTPISYFQMSDYSLDSWDTAIEKMLTLNCHTCSGKEPSLCREQVSPEWAELPSDWKVQVNCCHGNGKMPVMPYDTTVTLGDKMCILGCMWDDLTLTPRGLEYGQPVPLCWRYVDNDVKDDQSDGWKNLKKKIISVFIHVATTFISLPRWTWILQSCFLIMVYHKGTCDLTTRVFSYTWKMTCA